MTDRREAIMVRITELLATLGAETLARNLDEVSDLKLPAIILYDGDEDASDTMRANGGGGVMYAAPQIVITLQDVPESVGTTTNGYRARLISAMCLDEALQELCGTFPTRGIKYMGCTTSLVPGRSSQVSLTAHFNIGYQLTPSQL